MGFLGLFWLSLEEEDPRPCRSVATSSRSIARIYNFGQRLRRSIAHPGRMIARECAERSRDVADRLHTLADRSPVKPIDRPVLADRSRRVAEIVN